MKFIMKSHLIFYTIKQEQKFLKNNEIECNFIRNSTTCCIIYLAAISLEKKWQECFAFVNSIDYRKKFALVFRKKVIYKTKFPSSKQVFHQLLVHILIQWIKTKVRICINSIIAILQKCKCLHLVQREVQKLLTNILTDQIPTLILITPLPAFQTSLRNCVVFWSGNFKGED